MATVTWTLCSDASALYADSTKPSLLLRALTGEGHGGWLVCMKEVTRAWHEQLRLPPGEQMELTCTRALEGREDHLELQTRSWRAAQQWTEAQQSPAT